MRERLRQFAGNLYHALEILRLRHFKIRVRSGLPNRKEVEVHVVDVTGIFLIVDQVFRV